MLFRLPLHFICFSVSSPRAPNKRELQCLLRFLTNAKGHLQSSIEYCWRNSALEVLTAILPNR